MAEADPTMNRNEFEDLVDTYGGWLQSWPKGERERADIYLKAHPEAKDSLEQMQSVERALAASRFESGPDVEAGDYSNLVDRIMADVDQVEQDGLSCANDLDVSEDLESEAKLRMRSRSEGLPAFLMAGVMAASLLLGVFAGGGLSLLGIDRAMMSGQALQTAGNEESLSVLDIFGL